MTFRVRPVSEREFQRQVLQYCRLRGWMAYHTHDSRRSQAGFPDCVFVRGDRLLFAELKTDRGRTTPEQDAWLAALRAAGADARLWRPADWPEIEETLR